MDRTIIKQYEDMRREYEDARRRIEQTKEELKKYDEKYQVGDSVAGGMGGIQHFAIKGFPYPEYSRKKTSLMRRKLRMETLQEELAQKLEEVEEYIDSVKDSRKRLLLRYKYVDGLSWREIAQKIGGGNTEDSVRMELTRFLDKSEGR